MMKLRRKKVLSVLLAIALLLTDMIQGSFMPVSAAADSLSYSDLTMNKLIAEFDFGTDVTETSVYNDEKGYGFEDVSYPFEAAGWVNNVYTPRTRTVSGSAMMVSTVTGAALSVTSLAVGSRVWTETERTGYGVFTYEETSAFRVTLDNADYEVSVTLVNPTDTAYTAYLEAEDITKASGIAVNAGESVTTSFTAVLVDGQLNLKFLKAGSAASKEQAQDGMVYVDKIKIIRKAVKTPGKKPTIFLASDSTVQTYDAGYYPQEGWGQELYNFFGTLQEERECTDCSYNQAQTYETTDVIVENRAIGGRSSKSFLEEGKLDDLLEDVKPGDYVLVQWGHNDATYSRPNRYVSEQEFPTYLQYYIDGCRQRGATCVLVTPVARYSYDASGAFQSNFEVYRQAMITLGAAQGVPVLDLTAASIALCNEFGVEGSKALFLMLAAGEYEGYYSKGVSDATHLQYYGAYKFAQCVAGQIASSLDSQLNSLKNLVNLKKAEKIPGKVSGITTAGVGSSSVALSWNAASDTELYYIYRAQLQEGQTVEDIDFTAANKYSVSARTSYTDSGCAGGRTYVYAIRGFNSLGLGPLSEPFAINTKSSQYKYDFCKASSDPTMAGWYQVTSTQTYTEQAGYGWLKAPGNGRYRKGNGNAASSDMADDFCLGAGEFALDLPNGDYEIKIYAGDLLKGTSTIKASYTVEGTSAGTISARQTIGSLSSSVRVIDGQLNLIVGGTNSYINGLEITPVLLAPTEFSYSELQLSNSQATFLINFTGIDNAVTYNIYEKSATEKNFKLNKTIPADKITDLNYRSMAASLGQTRQYYVTAVLADGTESAQSKIISVDMTDPDAPPLEKPKNLTCKTLEKSNIVLQWDKVEGAGSYNVYRSDKGEKEKGFKGFVKVGEASNNSFTDKDSDLDVNIRHYYRVEAVGAGGSSEKSDILVTKIAGTLVRTKAENLTDRALVAVDLSGEKGAQTYTTTKDANGNDLTGGVYLSWRLFENDPQNVAFTVYRNNTVIASGITVTNYIDQDGKYGDVYKVTGSSDTAMGINTIPAAAWQKHFIELQLNRPSDQIMPDGSSCSYTANDMSVGDLDKDGSYELIVKWYPSNAQDNSKPGYTGTTILDAYDINTAAGTADLLWRIDLGVNIRSGAHYTQFQAWDFDGDGSAELICKTADGTTSYKNTANGLSKTGHVGLCGAESLPTNTISGANDYRNSSGYIISGPEYLTVFDGETGQIIDTVDYLPPRGDPSAWGDSWGNRCDRFLSCVAYLDGEMPSAVFARGYYTRSYLAAFQLVDTDKNGTGDSLQVKWKFDTNNYPVADYGETEAQGNHNLSVNDIDGDGKDEIIYGALVIDHNGSLKYTTKLGHGDALHVSDWSPSNQGLEIFSVHEHKDAPYQVEMHDAETGEILWGYYTGKDTGRGLAADIDPTVEGAELWSNAEWNLTNGGLYSSASTFENPIRLSENTPSVNFSLFWDGDFLSELQDHTFNKEAYVPISTNITKWNYEKNTSELLFESSEIYTSNGTKGNLGLVADILGDWREEIIGRCSGDDSRIRIYTTTIETSYSIPCLMQNNAYRIGAAWQNTGYNQPPHTDYLLSEGIKTAKLTVVPAQQKGAAISFTEASDGVRGHKVEGYLIYRSTDGEHYEQIDKVSLEELEKTSGGSYSYIDKTIAYNQKYNYKIAAVVDGKASYRSKEAEIMIEGTPDVTPTATPTVTPTVTPTATPTPTIIPTVNPGIPSDNNNSQSVIVPSTAASIRGDFTATGWKEITALLSGTDIIKSESRTISIEMGADTTLPAEAVRALMNKDIALELKFADYSWFLRGQAITQETPKDINLEVTRNSGKIPEATIKALTGERNFIPIHIAHQGEFGFQAMLTLGMEEKHSGLLACLYYYNEEKRAFLLQSIEQISTENRVGFQFTHASDYIIILEKELQLGDEVLDNLTAALSSDILYSTGTTGKLASVQINLPESIEKAVKNRLAEVSVSYHSDHPEIASVTKSGKVTARKKGSTVITVEVTVGGQTRRLQLPVRVKKAGFQIIASTDTIRPGEQFTYRVKCFGYSQKDVSFAAQKKSVIKINKKTGNAKAIAEGTTNITIQCGALKKKLTVKVSK